MKTATGPLIALLNSGMQLASDDLFAITLSGGSVLRYTSADFPIEWPAGSGTVYQVGPLIKRTTITSSVGVSVDSLSLELSADSTVQVNSVPLMAFIAAGSLDGATVQVLRAYRAKRSDPVVGVLEQFTGLVLDVSLSRNTCQLEVASLLTKLDVQVPRNLYQASCSNTLYDTACGLNRAALTVTGTASGTPTRAKIATGKFVAADYFSQGVITFTSGPNQGISRTIKKYDNGTGEVTMIAPFPFTPAAGDSYSMYPGCNKTMTTCTNKFNNLIRFRGFPFVPVPETVT